MRPIRYLVLGAVALGLLLLSSCTPRGRSGGSGGDEPTSQNLRPDDAPDFWVVGVSGHCLGLSCPSVPYSPEYLSAGDSLYAIAEAIAADGGSVSYDAFGDSFYSYLAEDGWEPPVRGFLELVETLHWVNQNWVQGFDNPTLPIVVAHSHGTVWAHTALHLVDTLPVVLLVDLDGESLGWESDSWSLDTAGDDWSQVSWEFYKTYQDDWPLSVEWDFGVWDAADSWTIEGLEYLQDIEDVVPWNVIVNIETASASLLIQDGEANHRLDGSQSDIYRFQAQYDTHGEVDDLGSETMTWLLDVLYEIDWAEVLATLEG